MAAAYAGAVVDKADQPKQRAVPTVGRAFLVYNVGRLLLFVAATVLAFGVFGLLGLELLLVALVVSALLSLVVLRHQREDLGRAIEARAARRATRQAEVRARLDDPDPR